MAGTHVEHDGCLTKIVAIYDLLTKPEDRQFVAYGRLVKPNGHYNGAPHVALYRTPQGFIAVT